MKSLLQYLFALALVILGFALLCNPSQPAQTTSQLQVDPGSSSQVIDCPGSHPLMRLA